MEQFTNNAATTLSAAITSTIATTLTVASAATFPQTTQFRIRIDDELLLVTAGAGLTTWTVTRGIEGTTAATHANGAAVVHVLTAGSLDQARSDFAPLSVCEGRLTLVSGSAVPTADTFSAGTVYWTPYLGNRLALYDGSRWNVRSTGEVSVAIPSTLFRVFDVFAYDSAGTVALETVDWNQSTASIASVTVGATTTINATAHGFVTGDLIGFASIQGTVGTEATKGLNGRIATVASTAANSFTIEWPSTSGLTNTASTGTCYRLNNTRATALTTQDGVLVKSGSPTRRYLGTGMTTGGGTGTSSPTSGLCEDSAVQRLLWSYAQRVPRKLRVTEGSLGYTYSTAVYQFVHAEPDNRATVVVGIVDRPVTLTAYSAMGSTVATTTNGTFTAFGYDTATASSADELFVGIANAAGHFAPMAAHGTHHPAIGCHYYAWLEKAEGSGTQTWYPQNGGLSGWVWG